MTSYLDDGPHCGAALLHFCTVHKSDNKTSNQLLTSVKIGRYAPIFFVGFLEKGGGDMEFLFILAAYGCSQSEQQWQAVPLPLPSLIEAYDVIISNIGDVRFLFMTSQGLQMVAT